MELSVWLDTTWAGQTEGPKLVAILHFFALLFQWEFYGLFLGNDRLLGGCQGMG